MKGMVFNALERLIEEKFGIALWNQVIHNTSLPSGGIYVGSKTYPDTEIVSIVQELSKLSTIPIPQLLKVFGQYFFQILVNKYPVFIQDGMTLKEFLLSIDTVIHIEVLKLNPNASLPKFDYSQDDPHSLTMFYQSPRKFCFLAEGLIEGAAHHFNEKISMNQSKCLHRDDAHCQIDIKFLAA